MTAGVSVSFAELVKLQYAAKGLALVSRNAVNNGRSGGFRSRFKGRGIDFEEVRGYQPGDDVRTIDWRVTARTGKPHTKIFHEERERTVLFLVDYSTSMQFGTQVAFKSVIAAQLAAILAWTAMLAGDRVGGLLYAEQQLLEIPANSGQAGILPLLKVLAKQSIITASKPIAFANQHAPNFTAALERLCQLAQTGTKIFVLSDFSQFNPAAQLLTKQLARHSEIAAIYIYDSLEKALPATPGLYNFAADNQKLLVNAADQRFAAAYTQQFAEHLTFLEHFMRSFKMPLLAISTAQSPRKALAQHWAKRGR